MTVSVVTGSSTGIGFATALKLAGLGHTVFGTVRSEASGAALLEARQKQARLQYLSAIVEQLVVDNKRARDTEAALLNMQMRRLLGSDWGEDGGGMLSGASNDLRTWRQP